MVQSLPGFLDLVFECVQSKSGPREMFTTEVLEAAHPLHRGPADHKRSVGPLLSLPEVYNQLFSFCSRSDRDSCPGTMMLVSLPHPSMAVLIIVGNEAQNHSIIRKFNNRSGAVRGHTGVCVERVDQWTQNAALRGSYVQVMELEVNWPIFTTCGLPVRKSWIQSQSVVF